MKKKKRGKKTKNSKIKKKKAVIKKTRKGKPKEDIFKVKIVEKKEEKPRAEIVTKKFKKPKSYLILVSHIKKALSSGYSKKQVQLALLAKNWPSVQIEEAFEEIEKEKPLEGEFSEENGEIKKKQIPKLPTKKITDNIKSKYGGPAGSGLTGEIIEFSKKIKMLKRETGKIVIGQEKVISDLLICLICGGNVLLEGVPGIAKTLIMNALAKTIGCSSKRIQFTADLLPTDITGFVAYSREKGFFVVKGPVFANFVLADEINRAPPKVQSALIEVMQEGQVTIGKKTYMLDKPFLVLATENPLENRGVYKLPEAQVDRFLFKILVEYPTAEQEEVIMDTNISFRKFEDYGLKTVISPQEILRMQALVKKIFVHPKIKKYIAELVQQTRPHGSGVQLVKKYIDWGASPRASINLYFAAKGTALLKGRSFVIPQDVKDVAYNVLRHRLILNYQGQIDNVKTEDVISQILGKVEVP